MSQKKTRKSNRRANRTGHKNAPAPRRSNRLLLIAALIVVALMAGLAMVKLNSEESASATTPSPAVETLNFALPDVNGRQVHLSKFQGKVVVLNFWATWCGPCRIEIPGFLKVYKKYRNQGLEIVGISIDKGGPSAVQAFMKKYNINYPVGMSTPQILQYYQQRYGRITGIPVTFFLDRQGRVAKHHIGFMDQQRFESEVKKLL